MATDEAPQWTVFDPERGLALDALALVPPDEHDVARRPRSRRLGRALVTGLIVVSLFGAVTGGPCEEEATRAAPAVAYFRPSEAPRRGSTPRARRRPLGRARPPIAYEAAGPPPTRGARNVPMDRAPARRINRRRRSSRNAVDSFSRVLWWLFASSAGARTRARVLVAIRTEPKNAQQLATELGVDYTTVRHHLRVLAENRLIEGSGQHYGQVYAVSGPVEARWGEIEQIIRRHRGD